MAKTSRLHVWTIPKAFLSGHTFKHSKDKITLHEDIQASKMVRKGDLKAIYVIFSNTLAEGINPWWRVIATGCKRFRG
jgi:hypothetical protein